MAEFLVASGPAPQASRIRPGISRINSAQSSRSVQVAPGKDSKASIDRQLSIAETSNIPASAGFQRFVFTDPVACKYLDEDPATSIVSQRAQLEGYELYIVEQWACSRSHPTFVITTFTGEPSHKVVASVLSVPTDESTWSPQLKTYFKALDQYHARRRETPLGIIMITNLSGFPSSLTVIPVPEGDLKKHRESFLVNENLKRLGCSGRVGFRLAEPSSATEAKFHQLYRTSDKVPLKLAVVELVKLCQIALVLCDKLGAEYADGLLCDVTEKAINDWWVEVGTDHYNIEPHDGILGPSTVAALLGMIMGARNRLNAYGAPVGKDAFDVESTKRGIAYFQRSQRLRKTRRLDRITLQKLTRATAKAAAGEGWTVPKAVKSTVAELSGKGGEMVMEMVGARDKFGIADIETVDIERFVHLVYGERAKWLWLGKPKKAGTTDSFHRVSTEDMTFQKDNQGGYTWASKRQGSIVDEILSPIKHQSSFQDTRQAMEGRASMEETERPDETKRTKIRRVTKIGDAKSSLGRFKDAVGLRGHQSRHSRDDSIQIPSASVGKSEKEADNLQTVHSDSLAGSSKDEPAPDEPPTQTAIPERSTQADEVEQFPAFEESMAAVDGDLDHDLTTEDVMPPDEQQQPVNSVLSDSEETPRNEVNGKTAEQYASLDAQVLDTSNATKRAALKPGTALRRTQSSIFDYEKDRKPQHDHHWPRSLSFSIAESCVLEWDAINTYAPPQNAPPQNTSTDLNKAMAHEFLLAETAKQLRDRLSQCELCIVRWVDAKIAEVTEMDEDIFTKQRSVDDLYHSRLDGYRVLQREADDILAHQRARVQDAVREAEVLGAKLEYEINALRGRVEDVEDGVEEYEKQVLAVEGRVEEMEEEMRRRETWTGWAWRILSERVWRRAELAKVKT